MPDLIASIAAIPIQIGIYQSLYYVDENRGSVYICTGVLSGRTAGRSFYVVFRTLDGDAVGKSLPTAGGFCYIHKHTLLLKQLLMTTHQGLMPSI